MWAWDAVHRQCQLRVDGFSIMKDYVFIASCAENEENVLLEISIRDH